MAFLVKRISESNVIDKQQQILRESCELISQTTQENKKILSQMRKTVQHYYLITYFGESHGRVDILFTESMMIVAIT